MSTRRIETIMNTAILWAEEQSKCARLKVGAVITDATERHILSIGYNGTVTGQLNCCEKFQRGSSGEYIMDGKNVSYETWRIAHHDWSQLYEVHAEVNALLNLARHAPVEGKLKMFTTTAPCWDCCKLIAAADIDTVYYHYEYDHIDICKIREYLEQFNILLIKV